jgi:antitoxin ParD1/3/4
LTPGTRCRDPASSPILEEQMEIPVSPEMERWIARMIADGRYEDMDEVVYEALQLLKEREEDPVARLDALRRDVRIGLDQLDRGEGIDGEEAFKQVLDWIAQPQEKSA